MQQLNRHIRFIPLYKICPEFLVVCLFPSHKCYIYFYNTFSLSFITSCYAVHTTHKAYKVQLSKCQPPSLNLLSPLLSSGNESFQMSISKLNNEWKCAYCFFAKKWVSGMLISSNGIQFEYCYNKVYSKQRIILHIFYNNKTIYVICGSQASVDAGFMYYISF